MTLPLLAWIGFCLATPGAVGFLTLLYADFYEVPVERTMFPVTMLTFVLGGMLLLAAGLGWLLTLVG